jgi:hypothetical protein
MHFEGATVRLIHLSEGKLTFTKIRSWPELVVDRRRGNVGSSCLPAVVSHIEFHFFADKQTPLASRGWVGVAADLAAPKLRFLGL